MLRVLLGIVKGGLVGAALGLGAVRIGLGGTGTAWLVYGLIGFLVGVVCGRPIWRQETLWTPVLKGLVGFGLCTLLAWLAAKGLGGFKLPFGTALGAPDEPLAKVPMLLGPLVGIVYGIFVELDDSEKKNKAASPPAAPKN